MLKTLLSLALICSWQTTLAAAPQENNTSLNEATPAIIVCKEMAYANIHPVGKCGHFTVCVDGHSCSKIKDTPGVVQISAGVATVAPAFNAPVWICTSATETCLNYPCIMKHAPKSPIPMDELYELSLEVKLKGGSNSLLDSCQ